MASTDSLPQALRASDQDRDAVIRALRDGSVTGRLSYDTFLHRLDLALHARHGHELVNLVTDLPPRRRTGRTAAFVTHWSAHLAAVGAAWRQPRLPVLVFPREDQPVFTIGRGSDCDLVLRDPSVSLRHAELRRAGEAWLLADTGSTNGTRVNGWRVKSVSRVCAGDWVAFGRAGFRLTGQP